MAKDRTCTCRVDGKNPLICQLFAPRSCWSRPLDQKRVRCKILTLLVQFCLRGVGSDLNFHLTTYVVPVICALLQIQAFEVAYHYDPQSKGLRLVDDPAENPAFEMDILMGLEGYWNIVTGEVRRRTSSPVALNTGLGGVLSGTLPREFHLLSPFIEGHIFQKRVMNKVTVLLDCNEFKLPEVRQLVIKIDILDICP